VAVLNAAASALYADPTVNCAEVIVSFSNVMHDPASTVTDAGDSDAPPADGSTW
jgi:hypothetical protein